MADAATAARPAAPPHEPAATDRTGSDGAARVRPQESLIDLARGVLHDLPGLIGDRVELLSLELHRAGLALVKVLALTVVAAILGVTAWLAMWSILVGVLMAVGWHWAAANGLVALINIGAAAWAVMRVRRLMTHLSLPATRQHLTLGSGASREINQSGSTPHEQRPAHDQRAAAA
jgi:hypothetical protein